MRKNNRTREQWGGLCRELARSGVSVQEFAERRGLNPRTLGWWHWKLGHGRPRSAQRKEQFVEVVEVGVRAETSVRPVDGWPDSARASVHLAVGAVTLHLGTLPPAEWVAELVRSC